MTQRRSLGAAGRRRSLTFVEFSPSGGLFQFSFQLGEALAARGHCVRLVTGRRPELRPSGSMQVLEALPTWHAGTMAPLPDWHRKARRALRAGLYVLAWLRLLVLLLRAPTDVVVVSAVRYPVDGWAVAVLRRLLVRTRVAILAHEPVPLAEHARHGSLYRGGRTTRWSHQLAYRRADVVFVLGARSRAAMEEAAPGLPHVVQIPHGSEEALRRTEPPSARDTPPLVLFFGTWTRSKGIEVLIEAFELVRARVPEARLTIAGTPGPDVDESKIRLAAHACGGVELRPGYVPIEEVGALLSGCRLVVLPYVRGNQSGVLHVAQTFSRPVVASAIGDIPDALGGGGLLVPPGNAAALADAMLCLLDDPELAGALGEAARRRVEREASWETVAELVATALTDADAGPGRTQRRRDRPAGG